MNKFVGIFVAVLLQFVSPFSAFSRVPTTTTERPIIYDPKEMVEIEVNLVNTNNNCTNDVLRKYRVEITNYVFFLVCDLKIRVQLPEGATLENVVNLKPFNGTTDQFIFPDSLRYLYVSKTLEAELSVKGGEGEPKITVLDAKAAFSPKKCRISKF
uniref:Esophageal gland-localized secretory protein 10 n=1 Tax=Heterodera glycines TaxID=51029 RepID=A0A0E3JCF8_HETGL|nr:esophageal gland-localized secretory protein 10 [Heterodera glycines]